MSRRSLVAAPERHDVRFSECVMSIKNSDTILAELAILRRWRRGMFAIVLASPPVLFGLYQMPSRAWREGLMLSWIIVITVPLTRTVLSPCPRCGYQFFSTLFWTQPWARACIHCGQEL